MKELRQAKSLEISLKERDRMQRHYVNLKEVWRENVKRGNMKFIPSELTNEFRLVDVRRSLRRDEPNCYFVFLSNYGYFVLNIWLFDRRHKTAVLSVEMYSQGPDGTMRRKGNDTLQAVRQTAQEFANATSFTLIDLISTNIGSSPLLNGEDGVSPLSIRYLRRIRRRHISKGDKTRFDSLMTQKPTKIKTYEPSRHVMATTESRVKDIAVIKEFISI